MQNVVNRKRGNVVRIVVEIDASQSRELNRISEKLGMSKADAIAAALNIWFNAIEPPEQPGGQVS